MKIHSQLLRTVHLLEQLRQEKRPKRLDIRFGVNGLEAVTVDGEKVAGNELEMLQGNAGKIVDSGNANK